MRLRSLRLIFLGAAALTLVQQVSAGPVELIPGLGGLHHPVSTDNPEAQQFFDQGLMLLYAFNHDEAERSFRRAAELDPKLAMAWWGVALAKGSNYNLVADATAEKVAYDAVQTARRLADGATAAEKAYIDALSARYSADGKGDRKHLAENYAKAMAELSARFPDDLDAATLHAESMMNLRPWMLWTPERKPEPGTEEIVAILESVLQRYPEHPGANHYYIHAVEASPRPERALPSALRLEAIAPAAGHLVHMPSHIYIRTGDFERAAVQNEKAIVADRAYLDRSGVKGIYSMMYYSHNIHFLAVARGMQGRYGDALRAANELVAHVEPDVADMPVLEFFLPTPILLQVKFRRWDDLLARKQPPRSQLITRALWHFGRGMAFAAKGQTQEAAVELEALQQTREMIPVDAKYGDRNTARDVLAVAESALEGQIALARKDYARAIEHLRAGVKAEDRLNYIEPADWYLPVRETLGRVQLLSGDATAAEATFRADLARNPRNPRSLLGLRESLRRQQKMHDAQCVDQEFRRAWQRTDQPELRLEDL